MMKRSIGSLKVLLAALLLAVPMGCRPDSAPSGPEQIAQPQASLLGGLVGVVDGTTDLLVDVVNSLLSPLVCPTDKTYSTSKIIGRDGGTIDVGPHTLKIPRGALKRNTLIEATAPKGSYAEVEFEPQGLTFEKDVRLTISYAQCGLLVDSKPPVIVYVDDNKTILEILKSTIDRTKETVTGKTDHFSSYILAE